MSKTKCPPSVVRDHLREHHELFPSKEQRADWETMDLISNLVAAASDVRRPGPKTTLMNFLEFLTAERRSGKRETLDAFLSTAQLDPGTGESLWAFVAAQTKTTRLQVAKAELESARTTERRLGWKRDRARKILERADKEAAENRARIDALQREIWRLE